LDLAEQPVEDADKKSGEDEEEAPEGDDEDGDEPEESSVGEF